MKEKDKLRVSTLRLISAAIKDRDIAARAEDRCEGIHDSEILSLLAKMVKQRKESAQTYEDNGRPELAERERQLKSGYAGRVDMGKAGAVVKAHLCNN